VGDQPGLLRHRPLGTEQGGHDRGRPIEAELQRFGIFCIHGQNDQEAGAFQIKRRLQAEPEPALLIAQNLRECIHELKRARIKETEDGSFKLLKEVSPNARNEVIDALRYGLMSRPWAFVPQRDAPSNRGWKPDWAPPYEWFEDRRGRHRPSHGVLHLTKGAVPWHPATRGPSWPTQPRPLKGGSKTSSKPSSAAGQGSSDPQAHQDPFAFVGDFREKIAGAVDRLHKEGNVEAADLFRQLRKQIDITLPEVTAEHRNRVEAEAIESSFREAKESAIAKARA
jgi:hypothetical protein